MAGGHVDAGFLAVDEEDAELGRALLEVAADVAARDAELGDDVGLFVGERAVGDGPIARGGTP
jgi:hypothetical protein